MEHRTDGQLPHSGPRRQLAHPVNPELSAGVSVSLAEITLRVKYEDVQPDVRVGEPVTSRAGIGKDLEGALRLTFRFRHQCQAASGHALPAWIAKLTGSCESLEKCDGGSGRVRASQVNITQ